LYGFSQSLRRLIPAALAARPQELNTVKKTVKNKEAASEQNVLSGNRFCFFDRLAPERAAAAH
jgi:hypothetical protein